MQQLTEFAGQYSEPLALAQLLLLYHLVQEVYQ